MINIKIGGIASAEAFLAAANAEKIIAITAAIHQAGLFIKGEVVESIAGHRAEHMSVDTGRFKNSVSDVYPTKLSAKIASNVEYAKFLEYGNSKMQARSHFRNTAKRNEGKIKDFIEKKIK